MFFKKFLYFFTCVTTYCVTAHASTPFSKYGIIQNVQNYSSNPFWNPDSPYNQRMPQPVYATGPDITTDECQRIVRSLVTVQCMNMNNCIDTQLSDIRPTIMLQLSRMSGGNYATACSGYLDGIFNEYISQYANAAPRGIATSFPTATTPNHNIGVNSQIEIKNPLVQEKPEWATEMQERKQELQDLQSQNGTNDYGIYANAFPTTYADISFSERMENAQAGYEPFKDTSAYTTLKIETEKEYITRQQDIERLKNPPTETSNTNSQPQSSQTTTQTTPTQPSQTTQPTQSTTPEQETPSEDTPSEDTLPENYTPTHNIQDDKNGSYAILFRPKNTNLTLGDTNFKENLKQAFWNTDCSDKVVFTIDDDAVINKTMHKYIHKNTGNYDYFLSVSSLPSAIGILQSDQGSSALHTMRKTTEQDAKYLAMFLQKQLKGTSCNNMEMYVVKQNTSSNGKISIVQIASGPFVIE